MDTEAKRSCGDSQLLSEQVALLYANASSGLAGILILTIFFTLLYWQHIPTHLLGLLITASLLTTLARGLLLKRYNQDSSTTTAATVWARRFIYGSFATGLIWGFATVLALTHGTLVEHSLAALLLGGICAGALATNAAYPPAFFTLVLPILPTLILLSAVQENADHAFIGALAALFSLIIFSAFFRYNRILRDSIEQRMENRCMLNRLKESNQRLRISEERFRDVVEGSSDWVWETNAKGNYTYLSGQIEELTGYTPAELHNRNPLALMKAKERSRIRKLLDSVVYAQQPVVEFENWIQTRCGNSICLLTNAVPRFDSQGGFLGYRGVHKNITERKQAEYAMSKARIQAESANKAKSDFLAIISHEIRTPMNGVLGMVELLSDTPMRSDQREYLEIIDHSGQALLSIINNILDFSKVEAGKMQLDPLPFDLKQTINDVVKLLKPKAKSKSINLIVDYPASSPELLIGDAGRLRQILINLVNNAIKFTEHGYVRISVKVEAQSIDECTLEISVEDTGIGIGEADQLQLFDAFTQADSSTTRKYGGTGLGLAICQQLVELMQGKIGLQSSPGEGSNFWLRLTLPIASTESHACEPEIAPRQRFIGRVLLAEDIVANQLVASSFLRQLGLRVDIAENGIEAVAQWRRVHYDLILMDCNMPGMDGYQATAEIRALEQHRHTPIIALTANGPDLNNEHFLQAGMDDFLGKPLHQKELNALLGRWLKSGPEGEPAVTTPGNLPTSGGGVIDTAKLQQMRELMGDDFEQLIPAATSSITSLLEALPSAIDTDDRQELQRLAHSIKSASANIGALQLSSLAAEVERQSIAIEKSDAHAQLTRLQNGYERVCRDLDLLCG